MGFQPNSFSAFEVSTTESTQFPHSNPNSIHETLVHIHINICRPVVIDVYRLSTLPGQVEVLSQPPVVLDGFSNDVDDFPAYVQIGL